MRVGGNVSYYRFFYASIYQVRDGGGVFLIVFSFSCIKIILKYSAYQCCIPPMAD